ncbi:MAG TPA: isochorismatase family protein [Myxococcota bacterium]|nr:isochorismatase family protein [Myxococcota bacterium]HNH45586.1 isochorismatase family protein [Myxococcota bacterium]
MVFAAEQMQLLLIDWQERLFPAMEERRREAALRAAENLLFLADSLQMPVLVSEQYPRGLGHTLPTLARPDAVEKLTFSAMGTPAFAERVSRPTLLVCGMETHICVTLTVQALRERGLEVVVVADACLSRREEDHQRGLEFMRSLGAHILSSETVLFGTIGQAGTPLFKEISRRIR